jgi:hypothetical protein
MPQKFKDNATSLLASGITDIATSLTVTTGSGDYFPSCNVGTGTLPSANDWFKGTLQDVSGEIEIVYVRSRTVGSAVMTNVLRGQEGTIARAWDVGTVFALRLTSEDIETSFALDWSSVPQQILVDGGAGMKILNSLSGGKFVATGGSSIYIPTGVFTAGQTIVIYNSDAVDRSIFYDAPVSVIWENGVTGYRTLSPYALCTLFCVASNTFRLIGAGVR